MLKSFAVPAVEQRVRPPNEFGLIGDRPFLLKITEKNGRNFIYVNVVKHGGHGAISDPPPS